MAVCSFLEKYRRDLDQTSAYFRRTFKQLCSEIPLLMLGVIDTNTIVPKFLHIGQFDFAKFSLSPLPYSLMTIHCSIPSPRRYSKKKTKNVNEIFLPATGLLEKSKGAKENTGWWQKLGNHCSVYGDPGATVRTYAASSNIVRPDSHHRQKKKKKVLPSFIAKHFEPPHWAGQKLAIREPHYTFARVFEISRQATLTLRQKCKVRIQRCTQPFSIICSWGRQYLRSNFGPTVAFTRLNYLRFSSRAPNRTCRQQRTTAARLVGKLCWQRLRREPIMYLFLNCVTATEENDVQQLVKMFGARCWN